MMKLIQNLRTFSKVATNVNNTINYTISHASLEISISFLHLFPKLFQSSQTFSHQSSSLFSEHSQVYRTIICPLFRRHRKPRRS